MKRAVAIALGLVFFSPFLHGAGEASKDDLKRLQGKWKWVHRIVDGKKGELTGTWTITGDEVSYGPYAELRAIIRLDPTTKPKSFDFDHVSKDGKVMQKGRMGIYEIDGDTFKICVVGPGKGTGRPKEFESKEGSGHVLTVLERVKDKK